jgi:hypothetical protein
MRRRGGLRIGAGRPNGSTSINPTWLVYMWFIVELMRDKRRPGPRRSVNEVAKALHEKFGWAVRTIRERHADFEKKTAAEEREPVLQFLRQRREAENWKPDPITLLGEFHLARLRKV